jgi:uncharacterized protein
MESNTDKKSFIRTFAELLVLHRGAVMALLLVFTTILGYFMATRLSLAVVLEEMIPPNHTYVKVYNKFRSVFGGVNTSLFVLKVEDGTIYTEEFLQSLKELTDEIYYYDEVDRFSVQSIALKKTKEISGEAGTIRIESLMWPDVPSTPEKLEHLRGAARDLYGGLYVSLDDTAAVVVADFVSGVDVNKLFDFTRKLKEKYDTADRELHIVGRPVLLGWIQSYMWEMGMIFMFSFLLICAVCYFYYRSVIGVIVPMIKALLTTIWGFGFIALAGYNVNPLMLLLPFFVFASILSHAVQIMSRFYEEYARIGDFEKALVETLVALIKPSFAAIVTDALGFSVLYAAQIPTIQILAILCTVWILSITIAVTFSAAAFFVIPMPEKLNMHGRNTLNRLTAKVTTYDHARTVMIVSGVILVVAFFFSKLVPIGDTEPGSPILWPDSEFNQAAEVINDTFTNLGTDMVQVYVQGPEATMLSPEAHKVTAGLDRYLRERIPEYGGTQSLVPFIEKTNAVLNEGDPSYEYVPGDAQAVGQTLYFFRSRGDPNDLDPFADKEWKNGNITFFLKDHKQTTLEATRDAMKEYFASLGVIPGVKFYYPGGASGLVLATNEEIAHSHTRTVVSIVIMISILVYVTYRSVAAVLLIAGMLLLADFLSLTYMYFAGIGLNLDSLPIAAIGMGRGVDYGIYILDRIKEEYAKLGDVHEACRVTIDTTGAAIIFTALTMVIPLVPWYFVSSLRFQGQMGILLAMILFWHAVGAIVYLTAGVTYFKPKSLLVYEGKKKEEPAKERGPSPAASVVATS